MEDNALDNERRGEAPLPPVVPTVDPHNGGPPSLPVNKHAFFAELYAPTWGPSVAAPTTGSALRGGEPEQNTQPQLEPLWPDRRDEWATMPVAQHHGPIAAANMHAPAPTTLGDPTISLALRDRRAPATLRKGLIPVIIAVLAIAVVAVLVVVVAGAKDDPSQAGRVDESDSQAHESSAIAQHPGELLALIPSGFPDSSCLAVAPGEPGVRAQVECGRYPGGVPDRAVYQRVDNEQGLAALLQSAQVASVVRVCPGRIQSPGPWRRGGTPARRGGIVFCGQRGDQSVMGWTDDEHRVFALISAGPGSGSPEQLYQWWSANS